VQREQNDGGVLQVDTFEQLSECDVHRPMDLEQRAAGDMIVRPALLSPQDVPGPRPEYIVGQTDALMVSAVECSGRNTPSSKSF
jgi:hypothetical protein